MARILIADDEPLNLLLYAEMLKSDEHLIVTAQNGKDAIEEALMEKPDLIILDWNMPVTDGLKALKFIKTSPELMTIPVVMITGIMTSSDNLKEAFDAGAVEFLRKPFDKTELRARVNAMILLAKSQHELKLKYELIQQNNNFINSLIETIPQPMVYYNSNGTILGFNKNFKGFSGKGADQLIGSSIYDCFNVNQLIHIENDKTLLAGLDTISYECTFGISRRDYVFSKSVFSATVHEPAGIVCIITDITELKNAHSLIIEEKSKELTSSALRLIHITEMNNTLIKELAELNKHTNKKGSELIRKIIFQFNSTMNDGVWNEFETRFENVYEAFYKTLKTQFSDLTPNELKLCAFLRLNLSTKEIAAITFQNPQSVDMARYRLRKKLNINKDENLVDYLLKLG